MPTKRLTCPVETPYEILGLPRSHLRSSERGKATSVGLRGFQDGKSPKRFQPWSKCHVRYACPEMGRTRDGFPNTVQQFVTERLVRDRPPWHLIAW